jgi:hypothetical protein
VVGSNTGTAIDLGNVNRTNVTGSVTTDFQLSSVPANPSVDLDSFAKIGKASFGGIALTEDESQLWLVNLNERTLLKLNAQLPIGSFPGSVDVYSMASQINFPSCTQGIARPFGINFHDGKGYLGVVCDGSAAVTNSTNVDSIILSFNPNNIALGFTVEKTIDLNYPKEIIWQSIVGAYVPWIDNYTANMRLRAGCTDSSAYGCPQPIISGISFDSVGNMIIGIMDRTSQQLGNSNREPVIGGGSFVTSMAGGDIIRLCTDSSNGWILEGSTGCLSADPGGPGVSSSSDGPSGTGEFFYGDRYSNVHYEIALGAVTTHKGNNHVWTTVYDPTNNVRSNGVKNFSTVNGSTVTSFQIVPDVNFDPSYFSKGNGLGAPQLFCNPAPIEIGNRVWLDSNRNGVQDADEQPLSGVFVQLTDSAGTTAIASATTDSNGKYLFSNSTSGTSTSSSIYSLAGLASSGSYQLRIDLVQTPLSGYSVTEKDSDSTNGGDQRDSDGALTNGFSTLSFTTTSSAGDNNHSYDFGFSPTFSLGNRVWLDSNNNGLIDSGSESGIPQVQCRLLQETGNSPLRTTVTDSQGYYLFQNVGAGNYRVECAVPTGYRPSSVNELTPNSDVDSNNNGISIVNEYVQSGIVTLGPAHLSEPKQETDLASGTNSQGGIDENGNMTVDFGFYPSPATPTPTPTVLVTVTPTQAPTVQPGGPGSLPADCRVINYVKKYPAIKNVTQGFFDAIKTYGNKAAKCSGGEYVKTAKANQTKAINLLKKYRIEIENLRNVVVCAGQCAKVSVASTVKRVSKIGKTLYQLSATSQRSAAKYCSRGPGIDNNSNPTSSEKFDGLIKDLNKCPTNTCK